MRKQLTLNLNKGRHGGRRSGSGRKRIHSRGVAHREREKVTLRTPLHINFKYKTHIRNKECLRLLKRAILNARGHGLRIVHFSLQSNHIHLIVESESNDILTTGMRSLTITFAKGLKQGKVQIERYHLHVLRTLKETRNAVQYVLFNNQKHEKGNSASTIDEYSSVLSMRNALEWIRNYAMRNKITLHVWRNTWKGDDPYSYMLRRSMSLWPTSFVGLNLALSYRQKPELWHIVFSLR